MIATLLFVKTNAFAQVSVQIAIAPPMMPVYEQPVCPVDGYIWTPGYWAYGNGGYYWVDGAWLNPVQPNYLWTPGYWGFVGGYYGWNMGYWGPHIGYYGGVCYGHGYNGEGYSGGRWEGGSFRYNTAVSHVNVNMVHNTYAEKTEVRVNSTNRSSFNGKGGVTTKPTEKEQVAMNENHIKPNTEQVLHEQNASKNKNQPDAEKKETPAKTEMNKTNGPAKNQQTRAVNKAPSKMNNAPKQQNNITQQHSAPKQARQITAQQNNQQSQPHHVQQQPRQAPMPQPSAPQQQRQAPAPQHSQASHGGGGHR